MKDFFIDNDCNFVLENNDITFTKTVSEYVAQKLKIALSFVKGESFLDDTIGIEYIPDDDANKNTYFSLIMAQVQSRITATEEVKKLISITGTENKQSRTLSIEFVAQLYTDEEISDTVAINI